MSNELQFKTVSQPIEKIRVENLRVLSMYLGSLSEGLGNLPLLLKLTMLHETRIEGGHVETLGIYTDLEKLLNEIICTGDARARSVAAFINCNSEVR